MNTNTFSVLKKIMDHIENKIPMIIVQVEPPQNAGSSDYFYRTHAPGIALAQDDGV